jgi:c-di-GMP-binding flagellar brake protein YcgR
MSLATILTSPIQFQMPVTQSATAPAREEKRAYPRLAPNVRTQIQARPVGKNEREYLEGILADVSLGGMFVEMSNPFPKGSLVRMQFEVNVDGELKVIRARALVRHTRRFLGKPGMGIEFIEFEKLGEQNLKDWLQRLQSSSCETF